MRHGASVRHRTLKTLLAGALLVGTVPPAMAQEEGAEEVQEEEVPEEPNRLYPRFRLSAGLFGAFFGTNLRLDGENIGTEIDLEDDLGFETNKFDFRTDGFLRLGRRHRIRFGYFLLSRKTRGVIDERIVFGDEVFEVDTEIAADFRTEFVTAGYSFSFVARRKVEVAAALGLAAMFTNTGIAAVGTIDEEEVDAQSERGSATFPVATLGLDVSWAPISRLIVSGKAGGLYVKISDIRASVGDIGLFADYFFTRAFGAGAGFEWTKLGVEKVGDRTLDVTYRFSGLLLYGVVALGAR
jgi:hypothetical protein